MAEGDAQGIQDYLKGLGEKLGDAIFTNINPKRIKEVFADVEEKAFEVAKQFGVGRSNITNIKSAMTDIVDKAKLVGLNFKDVVDTQKELTNDLGRNVLISEKSAAGLLATRKVLTDMGVSFGGAISAFKNIGVSYMGVTKQIETITNTARKLGVNTSEVTKEVVANLSKLNEFNFKNGVEGLTKMVAQAKVLRIGMDQIFAKSEQLLDPENAIQTAAALQRLGVTQSELLDPLRLMD
jgi:hypothetical protein